MIVSPFTIFAFAIAPVVTLIFAALLWFRREPISQPSIVAAISLELSSIAILLAQSGVVLLATFQEIATQRTAGMKAVTAGLLRAQRPLAWGLLDVAACMIALLLILVALRYSRDAETPLIHAYVSLPAILVTVAVVAALFGFVYLQFSTVDLVMMIVDNHRYQEVISQYGNVSPAFFAAKVSSRLVLITFLSVALFCALIVAGTLNLFWRQEQNARPRLAAMLTLGVLIASGVGALSEFGFMDYLQHVR